MEIIWYIANNMFRLSVCGIVTSVFNSTHTGKSKSVSNSVNLDWILSFKTRNQ